MNAEESTGRLWVANERVLVADDEVHIVQLCVHLLSERGYQVKGVTCGQEAMACLEAEPYDLLIVDIRMPDVDGLTVLRWGLALDPNLTTVVFTGYATMDRVIDALNSGARGFLLKPFGVEDFYAAIESALEQRQKEQEWLRLRAQLPILVISQTLMTEADVAELSRRLLEVVTRHMGANRGVLMLMDETAHQVYVAAALGLPKASVEGARLAAGDKMIEQALQAQEALLWAPQLLTDLEGPLRALVHASRQDSLVLVPLRTGNKDVGILGLSQPTASGRTVPLTPSDMNLLSIMGGQIAIALENARMYATEQQRRAELARALEQQLELDRLKNQLIQNVSHELRTPLAMILGYAELLAAGELGEVRAQQQGPLDIIVQRSYVLRELIDNITAILESEIRDPVREEVQFTDLVGDAILDFQVLADQAGLTLQGDLPDQVPPVLGDAEHLRRVVDNLIGNAIKFTAIGGTIAICLYTIGDQVVLHVADTGIGIDPDDQARIFDRFYQVDGTTRRTHGGCGLGLALVKEIVERHEGAVSVESQLDHGSTFTVRLPAVPAPA